MCVFVWQWRVLESNCPVCRVDSLGMKLSSSKHPATILALLTGVQPHPQVIPRFYLAAVGKNREKAWDHYYVTDWRWWTRLVQTKSTLHTNWWLRDKISEWPGDEANQC